MLNLPKTTIVDKRIPKEKFYGKLDVRADVKRTFVDQVKSITWRNKIAPSTMNLAPGKEVVEIEVFEIQLKTGVLDEAVLRLIDQGIPYYILFLLEFDEKFQVWTAYKEIEGKKVTIKPNAYYHTEWMTLESLPLAVEGLDLDAVYEHFVYQIAGEALQEKEGESLQESVERAEQRKKLLQQIATLQNKIRKEKQLNIQVKLNQELKQLKKTLEQM